VARCTGFKPDNSPCERIVPASQSYCYSHDPDRADERRRNASRAGKSKPSQEIRELKKQLEDLAADVLAGTVELGNAVVVNQIINTRARLIELERRVKETEELEERLSALEQAKEEQKGGRRWGAS
jgi:hypothetical protein